MSKKKAKFIAGAKAPRTFPSAEDIIKFVGASAGLTKRDISKAFFISGENRIALKAVLKDLVNQSKLTKRGSYYFTTEATPELVVLTIKGRNKDGLLLGQYVDMPQDNQYPLYVFNKSRAPKSQMAGVGDKILAKLRQKVVDDVIEYHATVIKILDQMNSSIFGIVEKKPDGRWQLTPITRRQDQINLLLSDAEQQSLNNGMLIEATLVEEKRFKTSRATISKIIGNINHSKHLSLLAVHQHNIPHIFPDNVLKESEIAKLPNKANYTDFTTLPFITIDPKDAKDHDDAVYALPDPDNENKGGYIVYVAIADVAALVRPNSELDIEAYKRGNSVYFPDQVIPMLPERISNNLCSLKTGLERPALIVKMQISASGEKLKHKFYRGFIKIKAGLSYEQAQAAIDGQTDEITAPILESVLTPLWEAYECLTKMRQQRAPLELELPEKKIILNDAGEIADIYIPQRLTAHKLIEELMIQANVCASQTLIAKKSPLLYRIHASPSLTKTTELHNFLQHLNIKLSKDKNLTTSNLNNILAQISDGPYQYLVNQVILRSQSRAEYNIENIGHFGLNLQSYSHFTSPIRRYSDLILHRALISALNLGNDGLNDWQKENLEEIATHLSKQERIAMLAERDTIDRLIAHYFYDKVGASFMARITGVTNSGLFVTVNHYGAEGLIHIKTLRPGFYIFSEEQQALINETKPVGYQLGDEVKVKLTNAEPLAGSLRFTMLSEPKAMKGSTLSRHKAKRYSAKRPPRRRSR